MGQLPRSQNLPPREIPAAPVSSPATKPKAIHNAVFGAIVVVVLLAAYFGYGLIVKKKSGPVKPAFVQRADPNQLSPTERNAQKAVNRLSSQPSSIPIPTFGVVTKSVAISQADLPDEEKKLIPGDAAVDSIYKQDYQDGTSGYKITFEAKQNLRDVFFAYQQIWSDWTLVTGRRNDQAGVFWKQKDKGILQYTLAAYGDKNIKVEVKTEK